MDRLPLFITAIVAVGLSGCTADAPDGPAPPVLDDAAAAWLDGAETVNLDLLGAWEENGGEEMDAWGDYLFVDRGSQIEILRVALDTTAGGPAVSFDRVATFTGAPAPKDVKVTNDGDWLILGNDEQLSAVGDTAVPGRAGGFYVVDVSDKSAPRLVSYLAAGPLRGPHMLFYHERADGSEYVYGANGDITINMFDGTTGTLTTVARYAPDVVFDVNRDPYVLDAYYQLYTHDVFVMEEPADAAADAGRTLMYTASWDAGLHIVDVTDATSPQRLGAWNDFPQGHSGNLHTVVTDWVGDRRITVGAVEVGFAVVGGVPYVLGEEHSVVYVWDTTDAAHIELLGVWENPAGIPPGSEDVDGQVRSTHNVQFEDGRIYLAHYALGVWVLDAMSLEVLAVHQPAGTNVWDVNLHDGVLYTSGALGIQALHFPWDELGPGGIDGRA